MSLHGEQAFSADFKFKSDVDSGGFSRIVPDSVDHNSSDKASKESDDEGEAFEQRMEVNDIHFLFRVSVKPTQHALLPK